MEIQGAAGARGTQAIYTRLNTTAVELGSPIQASAMRDQVEISPLGQLLDSVHRLPEIRHELVTEIRGQIASGVYETSEKWELALDRLMGDLEWDAA